MVAFRMNLGVFPSLQSFGIIWAQVCSLCMFGGVPQWDHLVLDFCLQGVFQNRCSISLLVIGLFKYLFLLDSILADCIFLKTCLICWHINLYSMSFCISVESVVICLYFLMLFFGSYLFSSWTWLEVTKFYFFLKKGGLLILLISAVFLSHLFILWHIFISFLLLILGLICPSSRSFRWEVFWDFSSFLRPVSL